MNIGTVYGAALALLVGATLLVALRATPTLTLPLVGTVRFRSGDLHDHRHPDFPPRAADADHGARAAAPGRPAATAATDATDAAGTVRPVPVREVFRFLWDGRAHFGLMFGGLLITSLAAGVLTWTCRCSTCAPTAGRRRSTASTRGIIGSGRIALGLLAGGYLAERFARRGRDDANLRGRARRDAAPAVLDRHAADALAVPRAHARAL
ncbi:MAG: hypothetical protein U1F06_02080 [Steroidobacteraceae bacterium]